MNKNAYAHKNKRGFTLAELLIVIAIIAVLVAVAIPVFSAKVEKARNAVDISNAKLCTDAISYYFLLNPDKLTEFQEACETPGSKHFFRISVDGTQAATTTNLAEALLEAGLIDKLNSKNRYPELNCKSKEAWSGYYILVTTYNKDNSLEFIYCGRAATDGSVITTDHSKAFFLNDPTDFSKLF